MPSEPSKVRHVVEAAEYDRIKAELQAARTEYEDVLVDRNKLLAEFQKVRAELQAARDELRRTIDREADGRASLATAQAEIERLKERQPDWSPGDVIAAYADGSIVLDDGKTTWNPDRACKFLQAETERMKLIPALAQNASLQAQLAQKDAELQAAREENRRLQGIVYSEHAIAQAEIERLKAENNELDEQIDRWESGEQYRPV